MEVDDVGPGVETAGLEEVDVRVHQTGGDPTSGDIDHAGVVRYINGVSRTKDNDAAPVHHGHRVGYRITDASQRHAA